MRALRIAKPKRWILDPEVGSMVAPRDDATGPIPV